MILSVRRACLVVATVAVLASRAGYAQEAAPTEAMREAERHYQQGQDAYDLAHYGDAISEWAESYALSREPSLLFNLGQAERLGKNCDKALTYYQDYLRLQPDAENRTTVEGFIAEMEKCVASKQAGPLTSGDTAGAGSTSSPTTAEQSPGRTKKLVGVALAGSGALFVGTGIYFGMKASSKADDVTSACAARCEWIDQKSADADGRRAAKLQWTFVGTGAAALVGGAVVYYLGWRDGRDAPHLVAGPLRDGGAGATASWTW